jgi:biopolymer transport protein ExbB
MLQAQTPTGPAPSREAAQGEPTSFDNVAGDVRKQLAESLAELAGLRERIAAERLPMDRQLRDVEAELSKVRAKYADLSRDLELSTLDVANLTQDIERRRDRATYLSNVLGEYIREVEAGMHIVELQRYREMFDAVELAQENTNLSDGERFAAEVGVVAASAERLHDLLSGTRFAGSAVDSTGLVNKGTFVLVGPTAVFRSDDGRQIGIADQRLGSLEPTIMPFGEEVNTGAAAQLVMGTGGLLPLDPTLGSAQKVEATKETLVEHLRKGGPVMYPMGVLAGAALLVVLLKWLSMLFVRRPSKKRVAALLELVQTGDKAGAIDQAETIGGPAGAMLLAGAQHLGEPRQLVEEVMFERVLSTRLRPQSWLPFVAICATSAPLLGLLGTVTGIMNTFTLMTVHGTGDPKTLSSGISEALITTETGLVVAIPSLLLHAFLSRRARGIVDEMEKAAVAFVNRVHRVENHAQVEVA